MRTSLSKILVLAAALAVMPSAVKADFPTTVAPDCNLAAAYAGMTPFQMCWGAYAGNDNGFESGIIGLISTYTGTGPWTWVGKTEEGSALGPFETWGVDVKTGTLTFKTPVSNPFAISLKAGPQFSVYYFANTGPTPMLSVDFNTYGVSRPGKLNGLSHASLIIGPGDTVVPEPSTFILLGTGLLFLFGVERRRRKA